MSSSRSLLNNQRILNAGLLINATASIEQNTVLRERAFSIDEHSDKASQQREAQQKLEIRNIGLQREVNFYKDLLSNPMSVIAENNESFKNTYELQQQLLADWVVSQKAFKELAINLGLKLNITKEEILKQGNNSELAVLNNENNPENKTNANDAKFIEKYAEKLKAKIKQK